MIVLVLLIVAAVVFGLLGLYGATPPRADWPGGVASLAWCVLCVALAFWHGGK